MSLSRAPLIASGFDNLIYDMPDGRIRRVPRTPEAREACLRQSRFLPRLASHLPIAVPMPTWDGDAITYRKLEGQPLTPQMLECLNKAEIATGIAGFLSALHSLSVDDAIRWGVPAKSRTAQLLSAADRVLPLIPANLRNAARAWRDRFVELPHPEVPIHGDLWYENILLDPQSGRISGVLDFDQAGIGDPAWDLATQLHCGRDLAEFVFNAYAFKDATLWTRAQALFCLRPFEGLDWAARNNDAAEFEDSLKKLQEVGVLPDAGIIRSTTAPWLGTVAE